MRKVLVFVLVLFCLILAMPLVSANPISPAHEANSQLAFVYPAITILGVVLADLAIYLIRRKSINKQFSPYSNAFSYYFIISVLW